MSKNYIPYDLLYFTSGKPFWHTDIKLCNRWNSFFLNTKVIHKASNWWFIHESRLEVDHVTPTPSPIQVPLSIHTIQLLLGCTTLRKLEERHECCLDNTFQELLTQTYSKKVYSLDSYGTFTDFSTANLNDYMITWAFSISFNKVLATALTPTSPHLSVNHTFSSKHVK